MGYETRSIRNLLPSLFFVPASITHYMLLVQANINDAKSIVCNFPIMKAVEELFPFTAKRNTWQVAKVVSMCLCISHNTHHRLTIDSIQAHHHFSFLRYSREH